MNASAQKVRPDLPGLPFESVQAFRLGLKDLVDSETRRLEEAKRRTYSSEMEAQLTLCAAQHELHAARVILIRFNDLVIEAFGCIDPSTLLDGKE
jgi:hypothetical protein